MLVAHRINKSKRNPLLKKVDVVRKRIQMKNKKFKILSLIRAVVAVNHKAHAVAQILLNKSVFALIVEIIAQPIARTVTPKIVKNKIKKNFCKLK